MGLSWFHVKPYLHIKSRLAPNQVVSNHLTDLVVLVIHLFVHEKRPYSLFQCSPRLVYAPSVVRQGVVVLLVNDGEFVLLDFASLAMYERKQSIVPIDDFALQQLVVELNQVYVLYVALEKLYGAMGIYVYFPRTRRNHFQFGIIEREIYVAFLFFGGRVGELDGNLQRTIAVSVDIDCALPLGLDPEQSHVVEIRTILIHRVSHEKYAYVVALPYYRGKYIHQVFEFIDQIACPCYEFVE